VQTAFTNFGKELDQYLEKEAGGFQNGEEGLTG
jgi:hypothetical protein